MGKQIGVITDKVFPAGHQSVKYDFSKFSPGCYLYTFKAGDFVTTGKINVVR
jgi:hypothetical protein